MYMKIIDKMDTVKETYNIKYDIIDNIDKFTKAEKKKIYHKYKKQYGKLELWLLLRSIYSITYKN